MWVNIQHLLGQEGIAQKINIRYQNPVALQFISFLATDEVHVEYYQSDNKKFTTVTVKRQQVWMAVDGKLLSTFEYKINTVQEQVCHLSHVWP